MQPSQIAVSVLDKPIKTSGGAAADHTLLRRQAELARDCIVTIDYHAVRGTCGDERPRAGLLSGAKTVEPRPSVFGGPDVYGLGIGELAGAFDGSLQTGEARLSEAKRRINAAGLLSGGHAHCAANGGFAVWLATIADSTETVAAYVKLSLGDRYDETLMAQVARNAAAAIASKRYSNWSEDVLLRVLGDEANEAIEILADVPHEAVQLVRNNVSGVSVDQTRLYAVSVLGRGSFAVDDTYASLIETAMLSNMPEPNQRLALHAREASVAAVAAAVPNSELYQCTFS